MSARDVTKVISELIKFIPAEETVLLHEIKTYKDSLWNQAPELKRSSHCWIPLQEILQRNIVDIDTEWKKSLLEIFNNP